MDLSKEFRFEASHQIHGHFGKCARLHGHSWKLTVFVTGDVNPRTGVVLDYTYIKNDVQPLIDDVDHHHLGCGIVYSEEHGRVMLPSDVPWLPYGFKPTCENLLWLFGRRLRMLAPELPWTLLVLEETESTSAALSVDEFDSKGGYPYAEEAERRQEGDEGRDEEERRKESEVNHASALR